MFLIGHYATAEPAIKQGRGCADSISYLEE